MAARQVSGKNLLKKFTDFRSKWIKEGKPNYEKKISSVLKKADMIDYVESLPLSRKTELWKQFEKAKPIVAKSPKRGKVKPKRSQLANGVCKPHANRKEEEKSSSSLWMVIIGALFILVAVFSLSKTSPSSQKQYVEYKLHHFAHPSEIFANKAFSDLHYGAINGFTQRYTPHAYHLYGSNNAKMHQAVDNFARRLAPYGWHKVDVNKNGCDELAAHEWMRVKIHESLRVGKTLFVIDTSDLGAEYINPLTWFLDNGVVSDNILDPNDDEVFYPTSDNFIVIILSTAREQHFNKIVEKIGDSVSECLKNENTDCRNSMKAERETEIELKLWEDQKWDYRLKQRILRRFGFVGEMLQTN